MLSGGCSEKRFAGPAEIIYWTGWSGHELKVQSLLINEFNKTHKNIRVRALSQFGNSGYQKVRIAFAGGSTPDVMSTVWADELAAYAMRDTLTPLDEYMQRSGRDLDKEFLPGIARMLRINGKIFGLAVTSNTSFIAYNRQIFEESGLNASAPPLTISQLDSAARACTQYDSHGNFVRYGFRPTDLSLWAYVFGGGWYDTNTKQITANSPQNLAALSWMASYARNYNMEEMQAFSTTFGSSDTPSGPFYVGKTAMELTGEWERAFIKRYAPELDWGWFALPVPMGGRFHTTSAGGSVFVIPKASRNKEAAWEFLNWISSPYAVKTFCWKIKGVPPLASVCRDPLFQNDPLFHFTIPIEEGPNSFGPPPLPTWPMFKTEIGRVEDSVMLGSEDPGRALAGLQTSMERELTRVMEEL